MNNEDSFKNHISIHHYILRYINTYNTYMYASTNIVTQVCMSLYNYVNNDDIKSRN